MDADLAASALAHQFRAYGEVSRNLEAVLFDFDGTLAPNLDLPDMRRRVIEHTQAAGVPEHIYRDQYIVEIIDAGHAYLTQQGHTHADDYAAQAHQLIYDIEVSAARRTSVFDAARPVLGALANQGLKTAIVTRNCTDAVELTFADWPQHTHGLFARDGVPHLKPDQRHFEHALLAVGARANQAAIVSDGAMDMSTGKALGMLCIGVLTGSSDRQRLEAAGADVVFADISQLIQPAN